MNARLIANQSSTFDTSALPHRSLLSQVWNLLVRALFEDRELKVVQKCDRFGNTRWEIRDPATHQFVVLSSEAEALIWVEKHRHLGDRH